MRAVIIGVLSTLLLIGAGLVYGQKPATPPPLPARDQTTVQDLKLQLSECVIASSAESKYEDKLVARIRQLEQQLADMQKIKADLKNDSKPDPKNLIQP